MKILKTSFAVLAALTMTVSPIAVQAQSVADDEGVPATGGLDVPDGLTLFGDSNPNLRKATAIVNGEIITGTDVDQRVALIIATNGGEIPEEEKQRLRLQVLRNLIDEALQIQEAAGNDIVIENAEIEQTFARVAQQNFKRGAGDMDKYLVSIGSSSNSVKRQIKAELAWSRLLRRKVAPFVSVSEDEVNAIIERLKAQKGSTEYRIGEIYLSATPETEAQVSENARRIIEQLRQGGSFVAYARQYSEASTAVVGGDLGWIRLAQLPQTLAVEAEKMDVGQIAGPIAAPGGMSILAMVDKRQVLTADPRDAVLSLKQVSIEFPKGMTEAQLEPVVRKFAENTKNIAGCGQADEVAKAIGANVVGRDGIRMRDLPGPLQQVMANLQIGQATPPYGSPEEGVRVFVLCGRDDPQATNGPSFEQVMGQLEDERINKRARIYLRDLRRDAVVEYN